MKNLSKNNTYSTSDGQRFSRTQIEGFIRNAKRELFSRQRDEHGYNFCQECKHNDCVPIDAAHIISVKECLESGRAEIAWSVDNMEILGRKCHQQKDGLNLQFKPLESQVKNYLKQKAV